MSLQEVPESFLEKKKSFLEVLTAFWVKGTEAQEVFFLISPLRFGYNLAVPQSTDAIH